MSDDSKPGWWSTPSEQAEKVTGSTVASTSAWSDHWRKGYTDQEDVWGDSEEEVKKGTPLLSAEVCFIASDGSEDSCYRLSIQGMRIRKNNHRLRVFLPHVVVDIETSDAKALRQIIFGKRFSEIEAGRVYSEVSVQEVSFYDADQVPPIAGA